MLGAFNNVLSKFIEDLIVIFPEENDFRVFKNGFFLLKKTNPRKVLNLFIYYYQNNKEKIDNKDDKFFLDKDTESLAETDDNYIIKIMDKLKIYWINLSDTNKQTVWKYLNTLIKISEKC